RAGITRGNLHRKKGHSRSNRSESPREIETSRAIYSAGGPTRSNRSESPREIETSIRAARLQTGPWVATALNLRVSRPVEGTVEKVGSRSLRSDVGPEQRAGVR